MKIGRWFDFRNTAIVGVSSGDSTLAAVPTVDDATQGLNVNLASRIAGEDIPNDVLKVEERFSYSNITSATTTTVKTGAGFFHALIINKGVAAATITVYDNTAGSGTKIATITFGAALLSDPPDSTIYNVSFSTGLTIVTSGATDLTVSYR